MNIKKQILKYVWFNVVFTDLTNQTLKVKIADKITNLLEFNLMDKIKGDIKC